ncbi:MAG TPA: ribosome silencing factor [Opitutaceae bacterium]|nr:ribosome silencing factor [Opitutaceae bacterium]HRJ46594.1 ribosome silencing factor [Opitutaceae bacterium]
MNTAPLPTLELVKLCCRALDEKKAEDLRVLDVREQSSITDYLVVATGTSETHLRALRVELEKVIDATGTRIVGMETAQESGWLVVDAFDVMLHLFLPESRRKYRLENLWKDAVEVSVPGLLAPPAEPRKKPAVRKKAAVKKTVKKAAPGKRAKKS